MKISTSPSSPPPLRPTFHSAATSALALCLLLASPLRGETQPGDRSGPAPLEEAFDLLDQRADWKSWPAMEFPRHPAERFLEGWTIVLDPGHGGDAHMPGFKRGPTGVREADINWRVAVLLERMLLDAGVNVIMTRSGDNDVSLRERAEIANNAPRPDGGVGADLFISLHHNASGNPNSNYTSVWFHGEADWSEPDLDAARYIAHALFRYLRTDAGLTSSLMSDQQMFPRGFGVLNQTRVPAILLESSFHSNPAEEQRLRDALYNLREAYAIYVGLCELAYGGRPTQSTPEFEIEGDAVRVRTLLDDGLPKNWWGADRNRTLTSTVQIFFNDRPVLTEFDPATKAATATLPTSVDEIASGEMILRIHHANFSKHHNWPQRYRLVASGEGEERRVEATPIGARRTVNPPAAADRETPPPRAEPTEAPELRESTRQALAEARPGDIVVLEELHAREVPRLPLRLTVEPGPQLVFSDMPEYFRTGDGVAMEERVEPGLVRLYTYHVPEPTGNPKVITALIENLGDEPMNLRFHRTSFPRPSGNYHLIGKTALQEFFAGKSALEDRQIAPGEIVPVDPRKDQTIVTTDQLVHGFYEFEIDQPARIVTLQRDPGADNAEMDRTLPRLPRILPGTHPSGAGRGLFPISNLLVTPVANRPFDSAAGARQIVVADGRSDPWVTGRDSIAEDTIPNKGNYGVIYRIRIPRIPGDSRAVAVLMHNLYAADNFCRYQASAVKISSTLHEGGIVPIPAEKTAFGGHGENVLLQIFPPLAEGERDVIEILFSPPGASCLPTPIFLVPL